MNFLLVNLAVADMTVAVFIAIRYIFTLVLVQPKGEIGDFVCQLLTGGLVRLLWPSLSFASL